MKGVRHEKQALNDDIYSTVIMSKSGCTEWHLCSPWIWNVLIIYSRTDFAYLHCTKDLYMQPFCLKYKVNKNKKNAKIEGTK